MAKSTKSLPHPKSSSGPLAVGTFEEPPEPKPTTEYQRAGAADEPRPPIPPPEPEVRQEFQAPAPTPYRVDRTKTKTSHRIREVLAEMKDMGQEPDYHAIAKRLGDYWHGVDWKSKSVSPAIYKALRELKDGEKPRSGAKKTAKSAPRKAKAPVASSTTPTPAPVPKPVPATNGPLDVVGAVERLQELGKVLGWDQVGRLVSVLAK